MAFIPLDQLDISCISENNQVPFTKEAETVREQAYDTRDRETNIDSSQCDSVIENESTLQQS